jgi:branched-chain amino acid transport system ATP-binding protein
MLKLESVQVSYGAIQAVKGVSLEVREGEVVTILGANGAGKSTLLKSIAGLEPVASGRILVAGQDCTRVPPHRRVALGVAMSPEGRGVFADQTVRENLMLAPTAAARTPRRWSARSSASSTASRACASASTSSPAPSPAASSRCSRSRGPS